MSEKSSRAISRRAITIAALLPFAPRIGAAQTPAAPAPIPNHKIVLGVAKRALKPDAPESELFLPGNQFPGSTIRVKKGQPIDLTIENGLRQATALHIHGMRGVNAAEQVPGLGAEAIKPGESRTIRIETPDSGTYFYAPVLVGGVSEQMERGLAGFFIVEETNPPAVDLDHTVALDDLRLDDKGVLAGDFGARIDALRSGRLGNTLIVNGKPAPETITVRPNSRIRVRLGNFANARIMPMRFENLKATVVALDGQACDPFDPLKRTVILVPGSRYDVMIDSPSESGQEGRILVALGSGLVVLRVVSEGTALPQRPAVEKLPMNDLPAEIRLQNALRAEVAITGGLPRAADPKAPLPSADELAKKYPEPSKLYAVNYGFSNGFLGKPLLTAKRGAPVVLALVNRTDWPQVITVHGHAFRLLHPMDDGWEPYFLDTIHLPPQTTSRIAFDAQNVGKWAIRSTIPEHFDGGVFTWFEVIP